MLIRVYCIGNHDIITVERFCEIKDVDITFFEDYIEFVPLWGSESEEFVRKTYNMYKDRINLKLWVSHPKLFDIIKDSIIFLFYNIGLLFILFILYFSCINPKFHF